MRKILLIIILVLLVALGYSSVTKGIQIGDFKILSIKQLDEKSKTLQSKIEEVNTSIDVEYPKKISDLKTASNNMKTSKEEYLKYTNLSTDKEIINAMEQKSYTIEFLWTKLGTHARNQGVNLTFEIVGSATGVGSVNDIKFTVNGSYIAITNFIYDIENDAELNFRIQNFKLLPHQEEILQGTFTVKNIAIQGNNSGQTVTSGSGQNEQPGNGQTENGQPENRQATSRQATNEPEKEKTETNKPKENQ